MQKFKHISVMLHECIDALNIKKDGTYLDGTLGGGGHSGEILGKGGNLIAFDLDTVAIAHCFDKFSKDENFANKFTLIHNNFKNCKHVLQNDIKGFNGLDGAILDLGISSYQIDTAERGFSYMQDAPLDMRLDGTHGRITAYNIVNESSEEEIRDILYKWGEEKNAKKIAARIVQKREVEPIKTTGQLSTLVHNCFPPFIKGGHPAKRTFQALRIAVNEELTDLGKAIEDIVSMLKKGARIAIISFHSLEDRIVKQTLKKLAENCVCDKSIPICVCRNTAKIKLLNKGIKASENELEQNSRAKSATLRIAEKL